MFGIVTCFTEREALVLVVLAGALCLLGGVAGLGFVRRRALARDVAQLKAQVAELEATKGNLQTANEALGKSLEGAAAASQAKSQFLATLSHELRTPLNAIIGFSEVLGMEIYGPLGDSRYRDYVKDMQGSSKHLLTLINDVLDFSTVDAGQLELADDMIDVGDLARAALRMVEGQAALARVKLSADIGGDLPSLRADERRVRQVLVNLLSNAIRFTPDGGEVVVSAFESQGGLSLRVSDNGIGMAAEDISRVLERFGPADSSWGRQDEGAGAGLPLSKRLMELHGGTLELASTPRVGTKATITFPASRKIAKQAAA